MKLSEIFSDKFITPDDICESIQEGIIVSDASKMFIYWNRAAREILEDNPDNSGDPGRWSQRYRLFDFETGEYLTFEKVPMIKSLNGEEYYNYLVIVKTTSKPGGKILSVNGRPLRSGYATVGGITTFRDVTEQHHFESKISNERMFYERILDLLPGIVFIKDLEGKYLYGNRAFYNMLSTTSLVGKTASDFLRREVSEEIQANDHIVLTTGKAHVFNEIIYWDNNKRSIYNTVRFPYRDENGETKGICGVARDITEEMDRQYKMDQEKERSVHISKLAAIGTLSAEIVNEIKNPLAVLDGLAGVLMHSLEEAVLNKSLLHEKIVNMSKTIERINSIVASLNLLSVNAAELQSDHFSVEEVFQDVMTLVTPRIKHHNIKLTVQHDDIKPLAIVGNRIQISQAFMNLVLNSVDALQDVKDPLLDIKFTLKEKKICFSVSDNGPGVPDELKTKIFDPNFTTKDPNFATGIGLNISQKIIESFNGSLYYEESGGRHAYVIQLPLKHHE